MNGRIENKRRLNDAGEWEDCLTYFIDGKEVSEEEFAEAFPDREGMPNFGHRSGCWPMMSDACAVHPKQVEQANARNKRHGVNVEYSPNSGRAIIPDAKAYKKLRKLEGYHFNNGYES
jgi:uncharacterized protein YigE (DUF2233 family)